ncbi:MAG: MarR family transcriptional regulator [Parvibaculum sp.]
MADKTFDMMLLWFDVFNEIGIIEQLSRNAFERVLPEGLSLAGFSVLNHFVRLELKSSTPTELASAFQVTKGAMTNTLHRLELSGLVSVTRNPQDGRGKIIRITPKGIKARTQSIEAIIPTLATTGAAIPGKEATSALPFLKKLRIFLDENR